MNLFQLSYHSIGVMTPIIIVFMLISILLRMKEKSLSTKLFLGIFVFYEVMLCGYFFTYSVLHPIGAIHRFLTVGGALIGNAFFVGFAYNYPSNDRPREARIIIPVAFLLAIGATAQFIWATLQMDTYYNFEAHHYNYDYGTQTGLVIFSIFLISLVVFIRKIIQYSEYEGRFKNLLKKQKGFVNIIKHYLARFIVGWIKFFSPKGKEAIALKSFALIILILLITAVANILNKSGVLSYNIYGIIYATANSFSAFYMLLVYINNSPEPTTFMVKLVGISLVSILLILGYSGNITLNLSEKDYDNETIAELKAFKKDIVDENTEKFPEHLEYVLSKPASANLFDSDYKLSYTKSKDINLDMVLKGDSDYKLLLIGENLKKVKKKNPSLTREKAEALALEEFSKTRKYKGIEKEYEEDFGRRYRKIGAKLFTSFNFVYEGYRYECGFSYIEYRQHTHSNAIWLFLINLITTAIVLFLFPKFFHASLVKPLNKLLAGVDMVNKGDLEVQVPIRVNDEIGFLSGSFNSMVASIRQARKELQDYADNLEEKVKERTREVQEKMEEVQKLKIQQDGDYFLTSLLAKPLFFNANKSNFTQTDFIVKQKKQFEFRNKKADLGGDICITGNLRFGTPEKNKRYTMALNGDAMGKSMQGAGGSLVMGVVMNSIMSRSASNKRIMEITPEEWLNNTYHEVNNVFKSFNGSMVISAVIMLIDDMSGEIFYWNAEHPYTVLYRDGKASFIEDGMKLRKLGLDSEYEFQVFRTQLMAGDIVIMASDGRDDIDLTPNEPVRTINDDETLFLKVVEESGGDIHKIQGILEKKGTITDDLSALRISYKENYVEEENQGVEPAISAMQHEPEERSHISEGDIIIIDENLNKKQEGLDLGVIYNQSKKFYNDGEVNRALELLAQAYASDQTNQKINKLYGLISFKGKDYETAIRVLTHYLQEDPDTEELWYYLAIAQKKMGNYLAALESSKKVYEIKPDNLNNLVNLADLYRLNGNSTEARIFSEKVLIMDSQNKHAKRIIEILDGAQNN